MSISSAGSFSSASDKSYARITISEGKFHQVKKMFLAYGVKVTYLKRISFGAFKLDEGDSSRFLSSVNGSGKSDFAYLFGLVISSY